jgi:hypothetical protein
MASEETGLTVIEQKEVGFYGDQVLAVRLENGEVVVPIRPICDLIGVDWSGQRRRINRDPVLSEAAVGVDVTIADEYRTVTRNVISLPLDYISGFLFGIDANRVKAELKERLIRYQRECYKVLAEAFSEGRLTSDPAYMEILNSDTPAVQTYKMLQAMTQLARNQMLLEARLANRLDTHEQRLERLEIRLGDPDHFVAPDQAMQISQSVKAVAHELGKRSGRNEYGGVYGELYRRYGINSYKSLPKEKFEDAMNWLNEWLQSLIGDAPF